MIDLETADDISTATETLPQRIMRHEGFCAMPKVDVPPMYVIGYGHDITESSAESDYANGISHSDAVELLQSDIDTARRQLVSVLPWTQTLPEIHQEILEEMVFQLGISGLLEFKNMLSCAMNRDDKGVSSNMLSSKWHEETPARCEELAALWLKYGERNTVNAGQSRSC